MTKKLTSKHLYDKIYEMFVVTFEKLCKLKWLRMVQLLKKEVRKG